MIIVLICFKCKKINLISNQDNNQVYFYLLQYKMHVKIK